MFDLFRSRDKAVRILLGGMLLLVALSMLTYLVPNYGNGGGASGSDDVVAEIGKDTITLPELRQVIQLNTRGRQLPPAIMPHYVPQFIDSMITERALAYEAQRVGFRISDADLAASIRQTLPQLFQDGKFAGKDAYAGMLSQENMTIPEFEADMTRQLLAAKMRAVAMEGVIVTPQEIEQEYKHRNDKVKIEYVKIAEDKLKAEVKPTPEDLHKYYENNKGGYQVPEKRNLGILLVNQAKMEQNIQPTDAELMRMYNDNKDNYRTPERVNLRHILLKTEGKNPTEVAAVKTKVDALLKQARGGADFAELAKKNSEDPGSAAKGGLYEGVTRGQMVPEFEKAAFDTKPGQISEPVKTMYGYHIILVLSHDQAQLKPFADVKTQLAEEYKKQRVNDLMSETADKAQAALAKDPLHPDKVAAQFNIDFVKGENLGPNDAAPEVGVNRDFQDAVNNLKKGEVTQAIAIGGNKIAFAVCTDVIAAHPSSFEEVQDRVRDAYTKQKAGELLDQKAKQLADKVKGNGGDLDGAAKSMGLEVKTSAAVDRAGSIEGLGSAAMVADAFTKPVGSIVGPVPMADGKVVAKVIEKTPAEMSGLDAQRNAIRDELKGRKGQARRSLFEEGVRDTLTKEGKIKIHQDVINRLLASYEHS